MKRTDAPSSPPTPALLPRFLLVVGLSIAGLWLVLLGTGNVPEIDEGDRAIWFHLVAEFLTALLLVAAGVLSLRRIGLENRLAGIALGALLYTTINSAGFYAERGEWAVVAMFAVLSAVTLMSTFYWNRNWPPASEGEPAND